MVLYMDGMGGAADATQAVLWLRRAALQGAAMAQLTLGTLYVKGRGVKQDLIEAHMWYSVAAARLPAGKKRGTAQRLRKAVSERMTEEQIAEAEGLATGMRGLSNH